jgi:transcriptional regulator with PAS, ATPase and Fis domain
MSRLRTIATDLVDVLDDSIAPVYVLDDQRRVVYCNPACARWTGTKVCDLLGQVCTFHAPDSGDGPAMVAAGLCPPPKVLSGHALTGLVSCTTVDGQLAYRRGHFWPLGDGQDESAPVLAILEPADCDGPPAPRADDGSATGDGDLHEHVRRFRHQMTGRFRADSLIGTSPLITRSRAQIELASRTRAHVLCSGPAGAGKAHAAKAIHYGQPKPGPLVPLACSVLDTALLQSALRSVWLKHSGANESSGTLLLEDVDCMAEEAQTALVQLLRADPLCMRVIATSTRPLSELVAGGSFLPELACALSTIAIELPPLSGRLEDVPLLAQAFLEQSNASSTKQVGGFTSEALDQLAAYPWHENLDELAAVVREAHDRAHGGEVAARDLSERIRWAADAALHPPRNDSAIVLEEFLARLEKELIGRALRRAKGNKSKAAKLLGLTRPRLYRRLEQLGLERAQGTERDLDK